MGRRSGGGGGNAWNDFQRAHGGQGLSRGEMSAMYQGLSAASSSTFSSSFSSASAPAQSSSAWNNFQHNYGGRGLSKQDLKQLYAHHKGDAPAASTSVRPVSSTTTTISSVKPAVNWNVFQCQYAGTSLSRQQVAHLYHAQQQQSQQQSKPVASTNTQHAQQKHVSFDTGSTVVTPYPTSGTTAPTPIFMASVNPYPAVLPFAYYPPAAPVYTAVFGSNPLPNATDSYNESDREQFHAVGSKEMEDDMVFFKYSVDSCGQDRSPEELAYKYYRRRAEKANADAKAKSVASAKALFVASFGAETAVKKGNSAVTTSFTASAYQSRDESKQTLELSVVEERDSEKDGNDNVDVSKKGEDEQESTTAKRQPETIDPLKNTIEESHAEAGDITNEKSIVSSPEKAKKSEPRETKPAESLALVISQPTETIATGLTGPVVKATIDTGSTDVVVKIVPSLCSKRARSQLATEMELLVKLTSHPHLVKVYGSVPLKAGAQVGVVAEFVTASETLATRLYRPSSSISEKTKHTWILQLLAALEHLHTHGITHRDLSPNHVLLSSTAINTNEKDDGVHSLKLIDFGLPTLKNAAAAASAGGAMRGFNPAYASPELLGGQLPRHDVDGWKKSDVFSATVLVVELLLEEHPWEGELPVFFMKAVVERGKRAFTLNDLSVDGKKSRVLTGIVTQAWHQDPGKRPTVSVLRAMLAKVFNPDDHD